MDQTDANPGWGSAGYSMAKKSKAKAAPKGKPPKNDSPVVERYARPGVFGATLAPRLVDDLTDWKKANLGPLPPVKNDGRMNLADIIGADGVGEIEQLGEIRFHALGDSGATHGDDAELVAEEMTSDFKPAAGALNPAFLFHLGDIVYGPGKAAHYVDRFYSPYRHYPGKIIAIPGNHDGETTTAQDQPSLKDYLTNFCADNANVPRDASSSGIFRQTMMQPGAYWLLDAPFVRIIGLYSNRIENPGYLEGKTDAGQPDTSQIDWLKRTLKALAAVQEKKALIIATHHPPFSEGNHSGSRHMSDTVDACCQSAGVWPDVFLSGHAHNFQRYTRRINGRQIPYIVAGTGGMPPQKVPPATGQPTEGSNQTTYDAALQSYGYLFVTVSKVKLSIEFWQYGEEHTKAFNTLSVDLATHAVA
jgi:predicted phosphodiesterase